MLGTWRFMTLVFLKQGQAWVDGHQAFTLAFFFYRTRVFPFSQHLPHPSLSHPPLFFPPRVFLHSIHHTSPFHSHFCSLKSRSEYLAFYILIQFNSVHFAFHFTFNLLFLFQFHFNFIVFSFSFITWISNKYHRHPSTQWTMESFSKLNIHIHVDKK